MRKSFWFCAFLLVSICACENNAQKSPTQSENIDSILALPPDTLEWDELDIPVGADGLFDDFFFNFVRNSRFQEERIDFPLHVENGKATSVIEREDWTFDRLEELQEVNTMIFDQNDDMNCAQDTSINDVIVECIYFNCDSVKQYVFKRIEGRWNLTHLNWKSFQQHPDGYFYAFYKQFANDSIFQGKRIRKSFEFKTYDEVMNEEIMGEVDAEAWWDYSPELPKDMLTNINYGHTSPTSRERHLIITSPSAGMSSTLKFRMIKWQWKLVGLEN